MIRTLPNEAIAVPGRFLLLGWILLGLLAGGALQLTGHAELAVWVWSSAALVIAAHVGFEVLRSLIGGQLGVDVIALAAIGALAPSQRLSAVARDPMLA